MPAPLRMGRAVLYQARYNLDRFTDTDATSLDVHRPNRGGPWLLSNGAWTISSGAASTTAGSGVTNAATVDCGHADVRIRCTTTFVTNGSVGLIGRFTGTQNYWFVRYISNNLSIFEVTANTTTQRTNTAITANVGTVYPLELRLQGTTITAIFNDTTSISYTSATNNLTATRVGIRGSGSGATATGILFDDFEVTRLGVV